MNNNLIEKVIKSNNNTCPSFNFSNPLLDHNVARALSKSFVKILGVSGQNSTINSNLRLSVLENIRRMCQVEPENHLKVDENLTELLTDFYKKHIEETNCTATESTDKLLDAFLLKAIKEIEVNPKFQSTINPEVLQALTNLNASECHEYLPKDVIHWSTQNRKSLAVLKNLWEKTIPESSIIDDVSIKLKSEIEILILDFTFNILSNKEINMRQEIISNEPMLNLTHACQSSALSFQICISVLHYLFMKTNFDNRMQNFIKIFIESVKDSCTHGISVLYPVKLSNVVVLLDIQINQLPPNIKCNYIKHVLKHLHKLYECSENDFILIISHFPQWFDIYFPD